MTRTFLLPALALFVCATAAEAQVGLRVDVDLPAIPKLVVVQPGVQVVAGVPDRVYFTGGWYWVERDGGWYRARSPEASFAGVEARQVPGVLVTLSAGRRGPVAEAEPPPPPPPPRGPPPPPPSDVVRTKELKAGRIVARVIYAKEVKARDGRVGRVVQDRDGKGWERGRSDGELEVPELHADVIYAKEIRADWIEAGEIHAQEVKIGR